AEQANPYIDFGGTPFYVQQTLSDWNTPVGTPRRAAISSFGAGGANAHLVLEQAPARAAVTEGNSPDVVLVSARDRESLRRYVQNLVAHLADEPEIAFADIAFTSQVGRTPMSHRLAVLAGSRDELTK